jgi:hypothetical protein
MELIEVDFVKNPQQPARATVVTSDTAGPPGSLEFFFARTATS